MRKWDSFIEPLYNDEYQRLFAVAYRKTGNLELAQDLVQDTFLLAIFNQKKLMDHPKPEAWLMQTLRNLILNELRLPLYKTVSLHEAVEFPASTESTPIALLLPTQLHDSERQVLIMRFEQQMSYLEMSKQLGISEALCRKRVSQAVIHCRELLHD